MNLSSQTTHGILFIIAAIAPFAIYMGLGPDGGGVLDASMTERLATWVMFVLPVALMMNVDAMGDGTGYKFARAGLLIIIISMGAGIVADAFNGAEMTENSEAVAVVAWSSIMLGFFITAIGYYVQKFFASWLCILQGIVAAFGVIMVGFIGPDADEILFMVMWLAMSVVFLLLGIFTLRRES